MSATQDPEELVMCPYDPVHRVAAKKLPYHISKCRKHYDKNGEYKTCPFNARHVVPDPEFHYHMETCDSKGAIDMEIAFEQSKHEISHSIKGCTDIPPPSNWEKPGESENWDDEDEDACPVLHPQPIRFHPPANLPRPTASRPISRFDTSSSPMSIKSPSRYPPGDLTVSPRGGRNSSSSRASRGRQILSRALGDEQFSPPSLAEPLAKQVDLLPILQDKSYFYEIPNRDIIKISTHREMSPSQPLDCIDPLVSYQNLPHNPSQTQVPMCNQQIIYPQLYPPQPQPTQYFNPPMSVSFAPQVRQPYPPANLPSQHYVYNPQVPRLHYMPPTNPDNPVSSYSLPQLPLPLKLYQIPQVPPNALQQPRQPYRMPN